MIEIKELGIDFNDTVPDKRIKDIPIYAPDDEYIGMVDHLLVNKDTLRVESAVVYDGIISQPFTIGSEFIQSVSEENIRLNRNPLSHWPGKKVYDVSARLVGQVKTVSPRTDDGTPLTMKIQEYGTDELIPVTEEQISRIGKYITLNTSITNNSKEE